MKMTTMINDMREVLHKPLGSNFKIPTSKDTKPDKDDDELTLILALGPQM